MQKSVPSVQSRVVEPVQLLNEHQVSKMLAVSVATLRRWRLLNRGPRFIKLNSAVRYPPDDLASWLQSRPSGGGQAEAAR